MASSLRTERVRSAGGVVVRRDAGALQVLLCGRGADRLWALPKGTPEPGESLEETAVREVLATRLKLQYILRDYPKAENPKKLTEHDNVSGTVEDEDVVRAAHEIFGVETD